MRGIFFYYIASLGLLGCVTPVTQVLITKFSEIQTSAPNAAGIWTTSIGPQISTIKIDKDGFGLICEDTSGYVVINKIKYSHNFIYVQNGMALDVKRLDDNLLEVRTALSASDLNMIYKANNDLKAVSIKCAKALRHN
ncbi:J517_1871 family lipoprotein [uncultured Acinetobacter sp.]|uniref:J517_1871 family lipoprotein n=1 Tax=uncultured Acinetobacter sp. TaxID=165433 RepID=UPI002588C6E0|nr:J517_1871 family lipoprotein [uncultured Acinetobacter sp.]